MTRAGSEREEKEAATESESQAYFSEIAGSRSSV
jgi:hypothetical protein